MDAPELTSSLHTFAAVLDTLIPASSDGTLPSAGTLGIEETLWQELQRNPGLAEMVRTGVESLERASQERHGCSFSQLPPAVRSSLLGEQPFLLPLFLYLLVVYYRQPQVLAGLGLPPRPPHPLGYQMVEDGERGPGHSRQG